MLSRSIPLHVGLAPVSVPAVIAMLVSVATVVSVLAVTTAAVSVASPPMAVGMAMFLDLSLGQ